MDGVPTSLLPKMKGDSTVEATFPRLDRRERPVQSRARDGDGGRRCRARHRRRMRRTHSANGFSPHGVASVALLFERDDPVRASREDWLSLAGSSRRCSSVTRRCSTTNRAARRVARAALPASSRASRRRRERRARWLLLRLARARLCGCVTRRSDTARNGVGVVARARGASRYCHRTETTQGRESCRTSPPPRCSSAADAMQRGCCSRTARPIWMPIPPNRHRVAVGWTRRRLGPSTARAS